MVLPILEAMDTFREWAKSTWDSGVSEAEMTLHVEKTNGFVPGLVMDAIAEAGVPRDCIMVIKTCKDTYDTVEATIYRDEGDEDSDSDDDDGDPEPDTRISTWIVFVFILLVAILMAQIP